MNNKHFTVLFNLHINEFTDIIEDIKINGGCVDMETIYEMENILQSMKIEIHAKNFNNKKEGMVIIQSFTKELDVLKRKTLLMQNKEGNMYVDEYQHVYNKDEIDLQNRSLRMLQNSHTQLLESEAVATETLTSLKLQREKLEKVKNNLYKVNDDLKNSNWFVSNMLRWWRG